MSSEVEPIETNTPMEYEEISPPEGERQKSIDKENDFYMDVMYYLSIAS